MKKPRLSNQSVLVVRTTERFFRHAEGCRKCAPEELRMCAVAEGLKRLVETAATDWWAWYASSRGPAVAS